MKLKFITEQDWKNIDKSKPIYVFGAGSYGKEVAKYLRKKGFNFKGFCLDDEYYTDNLGENFVSISYLSSKYENNYYLFYGVGSVDRLHKFMQEKWHDEALVIWDPWLTFDGGKEAIRENLDKYDGTLSLYADDLSRKTQVDFLKALLTGNAEDDIQNLCQGTYFNVLTEGLKRMTGGFVDCGAYDGDSVREYLDFVKGNRSEPGNIYAFEPDEDNYAKLKRSFENNKNVRSICMGCWDSCTELHFEADSEETSSISESGGISIKVTTIDEVVKKDKISCIKMDIEGSELAALRGAKQTIQRDYPMLLISAYHKIDDLITLPQYIKSIDKENRYKLYLRHHALTRPELVLYAIPTELEE